MAGSQDERDQMRRQRVFVVDNAPEILDLIREVLQEERYTVTTTRFVPQIFDQIAALQPSLLIIDLAVGERAGWDLLAEVQGHACTNGTRVIVVSTSQQLLDQARDAHVPHNARRYLAKPFDIDDLLAAVKELIGPA